MDEYTQEERECFKWICHAMTRDRSISRVESSFKPLWRMSMGNKAKAMHIIKETALHDTDNPKCLEVETFEHIFDWAAAKIYGDGIEIDWNS